MKSVFRLFLVIGLALSLQACQNQSRPGSDSSASGQSLDGVLMALDSSDPDFDMLPDQDTGDVTISNNEPESELPEEPETPENPETPETPVVNEGGTGLYVCILNGPGKSIKLGLGEEGSAAGQHKIPQVLCMTKRACLDIASQAFEVKSAEVRGYCKLPHGNPHVNHCTDAQLQEKIDELNAN